MTTDERLKQLEHQVAQLLVSSHDHETRMLKMKHKVLDLEQELKKLRVQTMGTGRGPHFGDVG